ncbi:MAG: PAS domain-containing protein [Paracoccaceae bacterium]
MTDAPIIPQDTTLTTDPVAASVLSALETDWARMNGRAELADPSRLDTALPYTFMLERTAPGATRMRVAGQALHGIAGMEPRGLSLTTFFEDRCRETVAELAEAAFTLPAIVGVSLVVTRRLIRKPARASLLLLPMTPLDGRSGRVLGALVPDGLTALRGVRFDLDRDSEVRCEPQILPLTGHPSAAQPRPSRMGRPQLRLVVDNG